MLAQVEELRHDLEVIAQAHERDVERKDALIQTLLKDLDEAEAQHETALRQHLRSLDRLIDIQDGRLASLEQEFKRELSAVEDEFAAERAQIVTKHRIFRTELLHTIKAVREDEAAKAASAQAEFEQVRAPDAHVIATMLVVVWQQPRCVAQLSAALLWTRIRRQQMWHSPTIVLEPTTTARTVDHHPSSIAAHRHRYRHRYRYPDLFFAAGPGSPQAPQPGAHPRPAKRHGCRY